MTDLTQFFNFNRPPNGPPYGQAPSLVATTVGGGMGVTQPPPPPQPPNPVTPAQLSSGPTSNNHVVVTTPQQQASFDINEFPSLSKMSLLSQMQASSRANYVNIAKDNVTLTSSATNNQSSSSSSVDNVQSEFTISSEDFPALPGSNNSNVSIIGTKANIKPSSTSSATTLTSNNLPSTINSQTSLSLTTSFNNQTTNINNNSSSSNSSDTGLGLSTSSTLAGGNNGIGNLIAHTDLTGTSAAIDQCGGEKSYFSPIVSNPQKSMWMNGAVDRLSLLGNPANIQFTTTAAAAAAASTTNNSSNHLTLGDYKTKMDAEQAARFKVVSDGLNDHSISGHTNEFYNQASNNATTASSLSPGKDSLTSLNGNSLTTTALSANNMNNNGGSINNNNNNNNKGVQISSDGRVTNIPSSMVTDQFGMIGLLAFLRAAETDPNLASVTFGTDLTALGLNITATEKLYQSFAGPWTDQPLKVYEIDYPVPSEYLVNSSIRDKLTQITLKRYHEDTIFFLFYMFPNDMLQIAAAIELYSREWRYHKEEKFWITRAPGIPPSEKTNSYERGTYYIFDAHLWRRVPREFVLEYDRLENKPTI